MLKNWYAWQHFRVLKVLSTLIQAAIYKLWTASVEWSVETARKNSANVIFWVARHSSHSATQLAVPHGHHSKDTKDSVNIAVPPLVA